MLLLRAHPHHCCHCCCGGTSPSLVGAFQGTEDNAVSDQNLEPFVIVGDDNKPVGTIEDGDAVVLFNFRCTGGGLLRSAWMDV